jgi:hypothetical protein
MKSLLHPHLAWYDSLPAAGTHGEFVDRVAKLPAPGPGGLAEYDPDGFRLLASIYSGTSPDLAKEDPPLERLAPTDARCSVNDEEVESNLVTIEFDNRGCGCEWKIYWLTPTGERAAYGEVQRDATFVQSTFAGHVWQLEASGSEHGGTACPARTQVLRYSAAKDTGVAPVGDDSGCTAT